MECISLTSSFAVTVPARIGNLQRPQLAETPKYTPLLEPTPRIFSLPLMLMVTAFKPFDESTSVLVTGSCVQLRACKIGMTADGDVISAVLTAMHILHC